MSMTDAHGKQLQMDSSRLRIGKKQTTSVCKISTSIGLLGSALTDFRIFLKIISSNSLCVVTAQLGIAKIYFRLKFLLSDLFI